MFLHIYTKKNILANFRQFYCFTWTKRSKIFKEKNNFASKTLFAQKVDLRCLSSRIFRTRFWSTCLITLAKKMSLSSQWFHQGCTNWSTTHRKWCKKWNFIGLTAKTIVDYRAKWESITTWELDLCPIHMHRIMSWLSTLTDSVRGFWNSFRFTRQRWRTFTSTTARSKNQCCTRFWRRSLLFLSCCS